MQSDVTTLVKSAMTEMAVAEEGVGSLLAKRDIQEVSVFHGKPLTPEYTAPKVAMLHALFPREDMKAVIGAAIELAIGDGWTEDRFDYAINIIKRHPYPTFTAGQFINIDRKITFGRSVEALRRKFKFPLDYSDIVIVRIKDDIKGMRRAYAYKEDAEDVMKANIVAYWDDKTHWWSFTGVYIADKSIPTRQELFKRRLFKYCDSPPFYNGAFSIEVVKAFYDKYSEVVPPGDMLLFETIMNFDEEYYLKKFNIMYNQNFKVT